jgi:predicted MFS family arabinose efflux permease
LTRSSRRTQPKSETAELRGSAPVRGVFSAADTPCGVNARIRSLDYGSSHGDGDISQAFTTCTIHDASYEKSIVLPLRFDRQALSYLQTPVRVGEAMSAANQARIELASSPPCEAFRPRFIAAGGPHIGARPSASDKAGSRSAPIVAFILAAALVGFATNLSMHLLNLRMQHLGISGFWIGVSVAVQALGIIVAAPLTKHIISVCGIRQTILIAALLSSTALLAFNFLTNLFLWGLMRFLFATGLALLFTASESLIISRANAANRGRVVGWYATALATGTTAGPLLVTVVGIHGSAPLLWGALLFWLATAPILACLKQGEELAPVVRSSTFATIRFAPIAFVSAFVFGVVDNGGMAMLSIYSVLVGYDYASAVVLAVFATVGAIVLQIPLGYSANRRDPRILLILCGFTALCLISLLPNIMSVKPLAFGVAFGLGGFLEGLYTLGLICIAKYYRGFGISSANGCFVSMCGFGELIGPLATGASMEYFGAQGFVLGLTIILAVYVILVVSIGQPAQAQFARTR